MSETAAPATDAEASPPPAFTAAEIGALAHLYRGEVYRSTIWRTRLDATTNWSVVSIGVALSIVYASPDASELPLLVVGALIVVFLFLEARRYRYFNVWRARARWLETNFYAPMLTAETEAAARDWRGVLAEDYRAPRYHVSYARALGRRLRRNYFWIFLIQGGAYYGKAVIHPTTADSYQAFLDRLAVGPIDGASMFALSLCFYGALGLYTLSIWRLDKSKHRDRHDEAIG